MAKLKDFNGTLATYCIAVFAVSVAVALFAQKLQLQYVAIALFVRKLQLQYVAVAIAVVIVLIQNLQHTYSNINSIENKYHDFIVMFKFLTALILRR